MGAKFHLQPNHAYYGLKWGKSYNALKITDVFITRIDLYKTQIALYFTV